MFNIKDEIVMLFCLDIKIWINLWIVCRKFIYVFSKCKKKFVVLRNIVV